MLLLSLRNPLIWKAVAAIGARNQDGDDGSGFSGVRTHENGIHLYKSPDARYTVMRQMTDYAAVGFFLGFASGSSFLFSMPLFLMAIQFPRKASVMTYFTWHAELLPHTEQVVFHKTSLFGNIERFIVDINNLEKIDSSDVAAPLMWEINMFDPDLCFRDAASGEIFVFDKNGQWNKDGIEHPLLY